MDPLHFQTRRHFFRDCATGIGKIGLASLLARDAFGAASGKTHFPAKVDHVIYLFMAGGPSQLELFDHKPSLNKWHDKPTPKEFLEGKRFAFMDTFAKETPKLLGCDRKFAQYGKSGATFSELLPHMAKVADDLTFFRGISTDNFNHGPAKIFVNTGSIRAGRPSIGSWVTYGIGSESKDLPGFVVLQSGPRGPRSGATLWSSGFLPTQHQGVPFRNAGDPILNLSNPPKVEAADQRRTLDLIRDLNAARRTATGDAEIDTRIAAYEMAYRMQTTGPELIDYNKESPATLAMYGAEPGKGTYANNCLLARRLVERGVRFVQLYHTDWDHHFDLGKPVEEVCAEIDRATGALITDLKQRGLLDRTLVMFGGEFGRTPMGEIREPGGKAGRNHHIDAFTMWMAGGGLKPGFSLGDTDEFGFSPVGNDRIHIHDVQATVLHLLGLDHTKLTFRFQGRDFRLTDVHGKVLDKALA